MPETLFRFVPKGGGWELDEYRVGAGDRPVQVGGPTGPFPLADSPFTDFFFGPQDFSLTGEQRAWFRYAYEAGPRPEKGA